jgi:lipid-binding SYLF domain-containing protein
MFMDDAILDKFRASDGWNVGVDGSIAVVRVGAGGAINTGTAKQTIIGFIFNQKGFMGNLTLEGTKLSKIVR